MAPKRLSASRLNGFLSCKHQAALWLDGVKPDDVVDPTLELVRKKGFEHEALVLGALEKKYGPAVRILDNGPLEERLKATSDAMASRAPLIYQAAFANDRWVGFPDFLVGTATAGGDLRYVPEDAKLSKRAKSEHLIQLNIYARLIEEAAGTPVSDGAIHSPGDEGTQTFDLRQTQHITGRYVREFEAFASLPERQTAAVRSAACGQCGYRNRCEAAWREKDSPVFVAGIRTDQLVKLEQAGITTLSALASLQPDVVIDGISSAEKIISQARLQHEGRTTGKPVIEVLPVEAQRGFCLLPAPEPGDLFFDIEGDPLYPGGLEYLFGLYGPLAEPGANCFRGIWAHDHAQEKVAFEQLIDLFVAHLKRYPTARIYHYAAYEKTALGKLASKYATREAELDQLLRERRFVDLYQVVRQGLRASTEGYSLKDLEKIYWGGRTGDVANAGDSIVEYERWRELGDPQVLEDIRRYNEEDVISTAHLRSWLEELRPAGAVYQLAAVEAPADTKAEERARAREAFEQRRQDLAARIRASSVGSEAVRDLFAELLWFHQRAQKPVWWQIFDRQTWADDDLVEDLESLGKLTLASQEVDKRSFVARYGFPPQDTRLRPGAAPKIAATLEYAGTIVDISPEDGWVVLRRGTAKGDFPDTCSLIPGAPIDQGVLVDGIVDVVEMLCADLAALPALLDLLMRAPPRLKDHSGGAVIDLQNDVVAETIAAVRALDRSALLIQGPPGTGKTYATARAIVALLQDGKRVGISSNSHRAIHTVLGEVEKYAAELGFSFAGVKKGSRDDPETAFNGDNVETVYRSDDVSPVHQLICGTAFHFAAAKAGSLDYLFVDEAGQVALGNLVAMAACARNLVLVGDQMQLPNRCKACTPVRRGSPAWSTLCGDMPPFHLTEGFC